MALTCGAVSGACTPISAQDGSLPSILTSSPPRKSSATSTSLPPSWLAMRA